MNVVVSILSFDTMCEFLFSGKNIEKVYRLTPIPKYDTVKGTISSVANDIVFWHSDLSKRVLHSYVTLEEKDAMKLSRLLASYYRHEDRFCTRIPHSFDVQTSFRNAVLHSDMIGRRHILDFGNSLFTTFSYLELKSHPEEFFVSLRKITEKHLKVMEHIQKCDAERSSFPEEIKAYIAMADVIILSLRGCVAKGVSTSSSSSSESPSAGPSVFDLLEQDYLEAKASKGRVPEAVPPPSSPKKAVVVETPRVSSSPIIVRPPSSPVQHTVSVNPFTAPFMPVPAPQPPVQHFPPQPYYDQGMYYSQQPFPAPAMYYPPPMYPQPQSPTPLSQDIVPQPSETEFSHQLGIPILPAFRECGDSLFIRNPILIHFMQKDRINPMYGYLSAITGKTTIRALKELYGNQVCRAFIVRMLDGEYEGKLAWIRRWNGSNCLVRVENHYKEDGKPRDVNLNLDKRYVSVCYIPSPFDLLEGIEKDKNNRDTKPGAFFSAK